MSTLSPYQKKLRERMGHELLLMSGVAALVRNSEGQVLLQRRSDDGRWNLPGGAVDPGEEPARSVIREVREETGLLVRPERLAGVFGGPAFRHRYPNGDEIEPTTLVFDCAVVGGSLRGRDEEALEQRFFPAEELERRVEQYPAEFFAGWRRGEATFFQWDPRWLDEAAGGRERDP